MMHVTGARNEAAIDFYDTRSAGWLNEAIIEAIGVRVWPDMKYPK